jgi:hypothetical protein
MGIGEVSWTCADEREGRRNEVRRVDIRIRGIYVGCHDGREGLGASVMVVVCGSEWMMHLEMRGRLSQRKFYRRCKEKTSHLGVWRE